MNASNQPMKRCSICNENATGFNFRGSLVSCNACKQFFYRFSNKFNKLKCLRSGNCSIDSVVTRNDCKKCRMDKCLAIGMKNIDLGRKNNQVENIKNKNDNEIVHKNKAKLNKIEYILEKIIENETSQDSAEQNIPLISVENRIKSVFLTNAELARIKEVNSALKIMEDERKFQVIGCASNFVEAFQIPHEPHMRNIISFVSSMSPFNLLSNDEQMNILKLFFCKVMFVRIAFGYDRVNDGFYALKNEKEKQSFFIPYSCSATYRHRNLVSDIRRSALSLADLMDNDEIVRDLILALLLFSHRNDYNLPEFIRYNYVVHCYLLKRYLEHKYQDIKQANGKFCRIMSLLDGIDHFRQSINLFLSEATQDDQIPQIAFEIHNLV